LKGDTIITLTNSRLQAGWTAPGITAVFPVFAVFIPGDFAADFLAQNAGNKPSKNREKSMEKPAAWRHYNWLRVWPAAGARLAKG